MKAFIVAFLLSLSRQQTVHQAASFSTTLTPQTSVSVYAVLYSTTNDRATVNFASSNRDQSGFIAKTITAYHSDGYVLARSSESLALYPQNWRMRGYFPPRIELSAGVSNPVYLKIDNEGVTLPFALVVASNDDFGGSRQTAYPLILELETNNFREIHGVINFVDDHDYFMVGLYAPGSTSTRTLYFWTEKANGLSQETDTVATLRSSGGSSLSTNDDGGTGYNFLISYTITPNTVYFLDVSGYGSNTGAYILRYSTLSPSSISSANSAGTVAPSGTRATGTRGLANIPEVTFSCNVAGNRCAGTVGSANVKHQCFPYQLCSSPRPTTAQTCTATCDLWPNTRRTTTTTTTTRSTTTRTRSTDTTTTKTTTATTTSRTQTLTTTTTSTTTTTRSTITTATHISNTTTPKTSTTTSRSTSISIMSSVGTSTTSAAYRSVMSSLLTTTQSSSTTVETTELFTETMEPTETTMAGFTESVDPELLDPHTEEPVQTQTAALAPKPRKSNTSDANFVLTSVLGTNAENNETVFIPLSTIIISGSVLGLLLAVSIAGAFFCRNRSSNKTTRMNTYSTDAFISSNPQLYTSSASESPTKDKDPPISQNALFFANNPNQGYY